jgi:murein DD-endopeptidase MepM/ murein hydrolase activator NlpD
LSITYGENIFLLERKKTHMTNNDKNSSKKFKIIYAFSLVILLAVAIFSRVSAEKNLGKIQSLENTTTELINTTISEVIIPEETVRQNITNVPDTRIEASTKPDETTESKYNTPYEDYYCLPFSTQILKDFSNTKPVFSKTMGDWRTHNGIDFAGEEGAAVVAISYGDVISVYDDALFGTCVLIDHGNGVTAKYCGLNKDTLTIKEHSTVNGEDLIGYIDNVPCETKEGAHLHFEITFNGEIVEPLELMGK